jgi:hypothetical protein
MILLEYNGKCYHCFGTVSIYRSPTCTKEYNDVVYVLEPLGPDVIWLLTLL